MHGQKMNEKNLKIKRYSVISGTIEDQSILRKFTILFLVMSVIPMSVLYYFYYQIQVNGNIQLSVMELNVTLIFVVIGVLTGYLAMRNLLKRFIAVTQEHTARLKKVINPEYLAEAESKENEIDSMSKTFDIVTSHLEDNIKSLQITKKTLQAVMSKVGQGLSNTQNIDSFLELILETITDALRGDFGLLMLYDKNEKELKVNTVYGGKINEDEIIKFSIPVESEMASVITTRKPKILDNLTGNMKSLIDRGLLRLPAVVAPLVSKENVYGLVAISGGMITKEFGQDDELSLLLNLASQTAVAIENSRLNENIEATYFETISALALAVDAKDPYSRGHLDRVAHYCVQIGREMKLEENELKMLRDAARLHDLGKIGIPDSLLKKEGPLSDEEWILMKKHPEMGESIIKPIKTLSHFCDIIRHHHEKLDGSGYPDGLKGDEITKLVRITTVADIFDALTTNRSYRHKMTTKKAVEILLDMKDQLDQDIVQAFVRTLHLD